MLMAARALTGFSKAGSSAASVFGGAAKSGAGLPPVRLAVSPQAVFCPAL